MYKIASGNLQHAARVVRLKDLQRDEDSTISPEAERDSIKSRMKQVEAELLDLPKKDPRRIELGLLKFELQTKMSAIRPKTKGPPDVTSMFLEAAREMLPRHTYNNLMTEAVRRCGVEPLPRK